MPVFVSQREVAELLFILFLWAGYLTVHANELGRYHVPMAGQGGTRAHKPYALTLISEASETEWFNLRLVGGVGWWAPRCIGALVGLCHVSVH